MPTPRVHHRRAAALARLAVSAVAALCGACSGSAPPPAEPPADHVLRDIQLFQGDSTLHDVRGLALSSDQTVWALAGAEPFLHVYSPGGRLTRAFGKKGRGPGELLNPWSLAGAASADPVLRVWDTATRRLSSFSPAGEPAAGVEVNTAGSAVRGDIRLVSYGEPQKLERLGDGFVVQDDAGGVSQTADFWSSRLLRLSAEGAVVGTVVDFREFLAGAPPLGTATVFVPVALWTTCAGEKLAVLDPLRHRVRWYGADGRALAEQAYRPERRPITDHDVRRYVRHTVELEMRDQNLAARQITRLVSRMASQRRSLFGREAPPAVAMLCDHQGRVWLNRFSTATSPLGYGSDWHVLDGTERGTVVRFPSRFRPAVLSRDGAYGVHEDELGVQTVAFVPFGRGFLAAGR